MFALNVPNLITIKVGSSPSRAHIASRPPAEFRKFLQSALLERRSATAEA
jgi:hypothetical protein